MAEIVNLPDRQPPPPASEDEGKDWLLKLITEWHVMRRRQQIAWAEHELLTRWGTKPDHDLPPLDLECLKRMQDIEELLSEVEPRTALEVRELLGVAVEILAYEGIDPEGTLASGPVLE
jgi:hypothetical protein